MNLFSYRNSRSLTWKVLYFIWKSCHDFSQSFYTRWWNLIRKWFSSNSTSCVRCSSIVSWSSISINVVIRRLGTIYSMGITASNPYTKQKAVWPINYLQVVLYAQRTADMRTFHPFCFVLQTLVKTLSNILLKASTIPLAWAWYAVLFWWYICNSSSIAVIVSFRKCVPLSLIKILGLPDLDKINWNTNFAVVAALQSLPDVPLPIMSSIH